MQPIEMARVMCEEVFGEGKTERMRELLANDFVSNDPMRGRIDRAGLEQNVQTYRRAFPDMRMEVVDSIASGDKVVVRWRATGTHKGELFGVPPTNRRVTTEGMTEMRVVNGKITEAWEQWNAFGLMRDLGAIPETASRAAATPNGGGARATSPQDQSRR